MKHIDILIHILCLFSGMLAALLVFLLYLKYKLKVIWNYSLFIFTTTLTVAVTTYYSYVSYFMNFSPNSFSIAIGMLVFGIFLSLINYAFSMLALGIMNKPVSFFNKLFIGIPWLITALSIITIIYFNFVKVSLPFLSVINMFTGLILINLFLSFVIYSIQIYMNLKNIENPDLKATLKVLAFLFIIYIPLQAVVIAFIKQTVIIFLSRNIFYFLVNTISVIFAARYFFMNTPSIMEHIEISGHFMKIFSVTKREKEVIELLLSGLSIKEISGKLIRSFKTVNNHIYNIYRKTNVNSKMELLNLIKENRI